MLAALLGDLLQHGGEGRQTSATRQQQQRPLDVTQVEAAQRADQSQAVAGLRQAGEEAAHQPARHVADQKADLAITWHGAEGIGPALVAARHPEVDVLPRQECQLGQRVALDRQRDGALGQLAHIADGRLVADLLGLAHLRGRRHAHHAIALGAHLAGQHVALLGFVLAERVLDVFLAEVVAAGFGEALAGTAGAVAAIQRDVDALAIGGVGHGFAEVGFDEAGHAVFEIQCDLVGHGCALRGGRRRSSGGCSRSSARPSWP